MDELGAESGVSPGDGLAALLAACLVAAELAAAAWEACDPTLAPVLARHLRMMTPKRPR